MSILKKTKKGLKEKYYSDISSNISSNIPKKTLLKRITIGNLTIKSLFFMNNYNYNYHRC
jgi:hypothetical protein